MPVGFQPIGEFLGISRCGDVECQRVLCFVAGAASDIFEGGRCCCGRKKSLRSQTLGFFASDAFFDF